MDLRRLRCAGPCACGGALVALMVPPLRFILASQAGLVIGWRTAAMPSNILTLATARATVEAGSFSATRATEILPAAAARLRAKQWLSLTC